MRVNFNKRFRSVKEFEKFRNKINNLKGVVVLKTGLIITSRPFLNGDLYNFNGYYVQREEED